jgi:starch synthase (maltosyl-transferring)
MSRPQITLPKAEGGQNRVVIENVCPLVDCGKFPIKRVVGDIVSVTADVFTDGHDAIAVELLYRAGDDNAWNRMSMQPLVNDRWQGEFVVDHVGTYQYQFASWIDHFGTWKRDLTKRIAVGQDVAVDLLVGAELVGQAADFSQGTDREQLQEWEQRIRGDRARQQPSEIVESDELAALVSRWSKPIAVTKSDFFAVIVDRRLASFSAWYEVFPRSLGPEGKHGTLKDVEACLPYVRSMGFDVLYLPPIHPIGRSHRKGRNNAETAQPSDVGSPWAIGSKEGGHKSIHSELGTMEDFRALVATAEKHGIELALDIAFQCSPDHPYVREHPEWFQKRPDGTIQYAENPPKKYQDIYPFDFECEAWQSLWEELRSIFQFWIDKGVRIFRVDNPHTKPFAFWEWILGEIRRDHPEVIYLSEAFTRPKVMYRLAKAGFSQSYTYFAWRDTKRELTKYFTDLTQSSVREYFRPNLWPNTPDILPESLQTGRQSAFMVRLVLAATLSGNYGVYGPPFEHGWSAPREPGSEEYLNSEKYQLHHHNLKRPDSLKDFIARINSIRRESPAIAHYGVLTFHDTDNEQVICYSRIAPDRSDIVLVVVNLDTQFRQSAWIELPVADMGLGNDRPYQMHDLLTDARYLWHGNRNYVELDPATGPAHIFRIRRRSRSEQDFEYYF